MQAREFKDWISAIPRLDPEQRKQLETKLHAPHEVLEDALAMPRQCPRCEAASLRPWGSSHGLPRYRCKNCRRTCNALTGTPLARLRHREQWSQYAESMTQSMVVRKAAKLCGVDKNTSFRWRHRFLRLIADHRAAHVSGIVEADETFFLRSFKGQRDLPRPARKRGGKAKSKGMSDDLVPVVVVRDRSAQHADFQLEKLDGAHLSQVLKPLINPDAVLCTDSAAVYHGFARAEGITHRRSNLRQKRRTDGAFHIQNVNAYHSRLKGWLHPFHGVATKYLANYLGWRRLLERYGDDINPLILLKESLGYEAVQYLTQT